MSHAITIGELLRVLAAIAGLIAIGIGALAIFAGGMSDAPSEGDSASRTGCFIGIIGIALMVLALAACATPPVQTRTVEVKIPVAVQPIKAAQVPIAPAPLGPRPQSLSSAADLLLADHCKWVAYGLLADPLLRVSAGLPPLPLPTYPECERR